MLEKKYKNSEFESKATKTNLGTAAKGIFTRNRGYQSASYKNREVNLDCFEPLGA